jgi:hypothetical protein
MCAHCAADSAEAQEASMSMARFLSQIQWRLFPALVVVAGAVVAFQSAASARERQAGNVNRTCHKGFIQCQNDCRNGTTLPIGSPASAIEACGTRCVGKYDRCDSVFRPGRSDKPVTPPQRPSTTTGQEPRGGGILDATGQGSGKRQPSAAGTPSGHAPTASAGGKTGGRSSR